MVEFISFLVLNIILARILSKKMRVAAIAHDVTFIVIGILLLFNLDNSFIKGYLIRLVGQYNYEILNNALVFEFKFSFISISSILVIEEAIFATFVILTLLFFTRFIKELVGEYWINNSRLLFIGVNKEDRVYSFNKLVSTRKKIYLENCSLLI